MKRAPLNMPKAPATTWIIWRTAGLVPFRLSLWQMTAKVYLPAMRISVLNGMRLGLGVAIVGVLLAETKLSNRGLGYLIIQSYSRFDMPEMYALLFIVFIVAGVLNEGLAVLARRAK